MTVLKNEVSKIEGDEMGLLHPRVSTLHRQNRERMDFRPEFHNSPLQGSPQGSSYSPQKFMSNRQAQQTWFSILIRGLR